MLGRLLASLRGKRGSVAAAPAPTPGPEDLNAAGVAALQHGDLGEAERALRAAIAAAPSAAAHANLGIVLWETRRHDEAAAHLRAAVALEPGHPGHRVNLANALAAGNLLPEAIVEYREALRIAPRHPRATAGLAKPLLDVCDWEGVIALLGDLVGRWRAGDPAAADSLTPFISLLVELPQPMRRDIAARHAARVAARVARLSRPAHAVSRRDGRLRLGYLSADFRDHAVAQLAAGLFEQHDRGRFEVHAYSIGADDGSSCRRRIETAFEHFHDVRAMSYEAVARRIAADGIDILVDLGGYTADSRPEILALRPAPIQVNWLGFPGTMAADFVDYIVADGAIIRRGEDEGYGERVVRLPHSYQANDDRQEIATEAPTREACGLPERGVVLACFNKHNKIERDVFALWMRVLAAVPESVLWLLGGPGETRLKAEAAARGIDPGRLRFAGKLPKPQHLARHRHADLFLDTRTYNAHTTASDALWAGVPVLTCPGDAFAGRVAASLLQAVGLSELVTPSLAAYEEAAIRLARDKARLADLRARLVANLRRTPLFDTEGFARSLEAACLAMHERRVAGLPPAPLDIAPPPGRGFSSNGSARL